MGNIFSRNSEFQKRRNVRLPGEYLNAWDLPSSYTRVIYTPNSKATRFCVCRCWRSASFPYCDNTHKKLQKQGIQCGPIMVEIRKSPPIIASAKQVAQGASSLLQSQSSKPLLHLSIGCAIAFSTG
ncbi:putative PfMNL-2 CISD1 family iron-sulfur protein [Cardiosporidium cionae]|uniref:PfMNL-2 CISD1 family iron-sulfur protein n=1 Tax=Cardiosporidium cionae TaxID=476202 RepID=A0ABQ7JA45_9APIC|nr:putative PfMNL-2 CISD1 family iron-sulfur protein [Cardiosporidium cionae]|eukprot:KAF8820873.1 putative PfMNL-2 CISD1 family iron-sulfur protein [Cardiosporidium cionae]